VINKLVFSPNILVILPKEIPIPMDRNLQMLAGSSSTLSAGRLTAIYEKKERQSTEK